VPPCQPLDTESVLVARPSSHQRLFDGTTLTVSQSQRSYIYIYIFLIINLIPNAFILRDGAHSAPDSETILQFNSAEMMIYLCSLHPSAAASVNTNEETHSHCQLSIMSEAFFLPRSPARTAAHMHPELFSSLWRSACPLVHSALPSKPCMVSAFEISPQRGKTLVNTISSAQCTRIGPSPSGSIASRLPVGIACYQGGALNISEKYVQM